jgi:GNAT superfamily N-acetyltransferase
MILRAAIQPDRADVVSLALDFHNSTPYARLLAVDPERIGAQFDVARTHGVVLVGERGNVPTPAGPELVGFFALAALDHALSGERYAEEMGWWVAPEFRSGTLGPRLLRRAEEWASTHGCAFIKVAAPFDPELDRVGSRVGRFYELQGYQPIETAYFKRVA